MWVPHTLTNRKLNSSLGWTELYRLNAVTYIMSDRQEQISGGKSSETHNKIQLAIACMAKW